MRPTLEKQVADRKRQEEIAKLMDEECVRLLMPHTFWQRIDFWIFEYFPLAHALFWEAICWLAPYSPNTYSRHWRWEQLE